MMNKSRSSVLYLIIASITAWLMLPRMATKGMFMDGLYYGAIARNMALGQGSFWAPHYNGLQDNVFFGHPPLVFFLESLFFRVFGDHFYIESLYNTSVLLLTVFLFFQLWKAAGNKNGFWLPLLLWIVSPVVYLAYPNNVLEPTLGMFCLAAILLISKADQRNLAKGWYLYVFSGFAIAAAALSKGLPALFPLAAVPIAFLVYRRYSFWQALARTSIVGCSAGVILGFLFLVYPPSKFFLHQYMARQVISSLAGRQSNTGHFLIIGELAGDLLPAFAVIAGMWFYSRKHVFRLAREDKRSSLFFLLIALSASLPILISPKQMGFYAHPSLIYFALSAGCLCRNLIPFIQSWLSTKTRRWMTALSLISLAGTVLYSTILWGHPGREEGLQSDAAAIHSATGDGAYIHATSELMFDYSLSGYLERFYQITLNYDPVPARYMLAPAGYSAGEKYIRVDVPLQHYTLFRKK